MWMRCTDNRYRHWDRYGGRGIKVCDRWVSFDAFRDDMGKRPSRKHTIDRINNDGNYEPNNCRWASPSEQQSNRSNNRVLTCKGETMTICAWSRRLGIRNTTLNERLKRGWTVEKALMHPVRLKRPNGTFSVEVES